MAEPERERRLRELFDRALSLAPEQREQVIAGAGDNVLAERLRALLAQDAGGTVGPLQHAPGSRMQVLRRIGRYELLRELGTGGMGTVVLARQVEPVERLVALKMVHGGDSAEVEQRFAIERQALAVMNHPGIAHIFDGGTTDDGVSYFAMEYVPGKPITDYCDRRRLDVRARIQLFVQVCDAVQHAHQKAVLHRDLKPGNVLVTETGGRAQPKVIDFGVARALAGRLGAQQPTSGGVMVGTLTYMSPEQADPGGQDIDTRADIYSLGVMLYELLTGELPLTLDGERKGVLGFQRALLETPAPRASALLRTLPIDRQQQRARDRSTTPAMLQHELADDLDWILLRALEKDRNRRYASATELAADLQRHLRNEPVTAGPPTTRYLVTKFVRRHRLAVLGTVVLVLGLAAGAVVATQGMLAARAARDSEAQARRQQARQLLRERAVGDFFEFVLFFGDPGTDARPPSLREVLDRLTPTIDQRFRDQPIEAAAVHAGVGRAYLATGDTAKAAQRLEAAWALLSANDVLDPGEACLVLADLARARRLAGGPSADRADLARMLELGAAALVHAPVAVAPQLRQLAALVLAPGDADELETRCGELLDLVAGRPRDAETTRIVGRLLGAVALRLAEEGRSGGPRFLERLEQVTRQTLDDDVDFLQLLGRFADFQLGIGRFDDARRCSSEVLDGLQRLGLRGHWLQLRAERVHGLALALGGEPAVGETELVALQRRLWDLPQGANQQAHAAAKTLAELGARLAERGQVESFLTASLQRWLKVAELEPRNPPWWPAGVDGMPRAASDAALAVVRQAGGTAPAGLQPLLRGIEGSLLLRLDRGQEAVATLTAALTALPSPSPELRADVALAQRRVGNDAAADAIVLDLQAAARGEDALAERCRRCLQRAGVAAGR
ncbi:MAG TPA: serine/threonine-protein kinase [Planctomycetota bacterium]|nr:serine/threonine-protein kinase [Planctomycetota bacterium]